MSRDAVALALGTVLAVGALAYVLYPLFFDADTTKAPVKEGPVDVEARISAYRAQRRECPRCGLRPETDALYCSTCGDYLGSTQ